MMEGASHGHGHARLDDDEDDDVGMLALCDIPRRGGRDSSMWEE